MQTSSVIYRIFSNIDFPLNLVLCRKSTILSISSNIIGLVIKKSSYFCRGLHTDVNYYNPSKGQYVLGGLATHNLRVM